MSHHTTGPVVLLGARSDIGLEVATRVCAGRPVVLAARRSRELQRQVTVLRRAGAAAVHTVEFDADAVEAHAALLTEIEAAVGPPSLWIVAFGVLGDQRAAEESGVRAAAIIHTDFTAQAALLTALSRRATTSAKPVQVLTFSSIAGTRVRRANFVYGSAKAGLDGFLAGLQDALHGTGVRVYVIRPGFVIGAMTQGMKPAIFSQTSAEVAEFAVRALSGTRLTRWTRWELAGLAALTRIVPRPIWRRLPR